MASCGEVTSPSVDATGGEPMTIDARPADARPIDGPPGPPIDGPPIDAPATKKVFITSITFYPDLGGTSGADSTCQNLANAAGLPGVFRAWLSTMPDPVNTRFTQAEVPYTLVDGTVIANNWADLTDGALARAIDLTETGQPLPTTDIPNCHGAPRCGQTFTGTATDGTYLDSQGLNCQGWTTRIFEVMSGGLNTFTGGDSAFAKSEWTTRAIGFRCDYQARLYCFQQ